MQPRGSQHRFEYRPRLPVQGVSAETEKKKKKKPALDLHLELEGMRRHKNLHLELDLILYATTRETSFGTRVRIENGIKLLFSNYNHYCGGLFPLYVLRFCKM